MSAAGAAAALLAGKSVRGEITVEHEILVYKSPTCGCCKLWVDHLAAAGFRPTVRDVMNVAPLKRELGISVPLSSCHTAVAGGYVFEGHVPADLALKVLSEKPQALGLVVPGMPMGSPGMEGPTSQPYDVLLLRRDGTTEVYASR